MRNQDFESCDSAENVNLVETKVEKPQNVIKEITICNSDNEFNSDEDLLSTNNIDIIQKINEQPKVNYKYLANNAILRGLLPCENEKLDSQILNFPVVKRCCIEHCYFARSRSGTSRYNLRNLPANDSNTLPFQNQNQTEQQTINFERDPREEVNIVPENESTIECVNEKEFKFLGNSRSSCESDVESIADGSNDKHYLPEKNSNKNDSVTSNESGVLLKQICIKSDKNTSRTDKNSLKYVSASDEHKKTLWRNRLGISSYPNTKKIPNNFVSVHDLLKKLKNMQKLMKAKYDKKFAGESDKIPPPKLKRMINRGKSDEFPKISEYLFPMPNLTKINSGKNWRVDYMDSDIQSLGLDDLLLRASELNAENFTKALGRKLDSVKSNFSSKDGSEIVLTIPKSKRNSTEYKSVSSEVEGEFSKRSNIKVKKSEFSSMFFDSDKIKESEGSQNISKIMGESSPKKLGIKVKTVENINDEFKDSLELKKKNFEDCNSSNSDKSSLDCKSESSSDDKIVTKNEKQKNSQEDSVEDCDEGTPFIMTIVQSKTEKQRPAILRNSTYFKKKAVSSNGTKINEKDNEKTKVEREQNLFENVSEAKHYENEISDPINAKFQKCDNGDVNLSNLDNAEVSANGFYSKSIEETEEDGATKSKLSFKKKSISFSLNSGRKSRVSESSGQENSTGNGNSVAQPSSSPANKSTKTKERCEETEKANEKVFKVTSIEQKLGGKEFNRRFIKVVPYESVNVAVRKGDVSNATEPQSKNSDEDSEKNLGKDLKGSQVLSLTAFSAILKEILPDKWFLCLDKKYGLQIIKTHVDEFLNPSILISVVIARCGKLTVNVQGKQLDQSHQLFSNLCEIGNSENKLSINYVLAILNKLRYLSVCFGCDTSLKKFWPKDTLSEANTNREQVYRSHLCHLLVSLGKKRCYPCYRINESLKKRYRRDKLEGKSKGEPGKDSSPNEGNEVRETEYSNKSSIPSKGVKRNLEDFLEESFSTMRQQITDEIEKNKKLGEKENAMKAQEEVLSFMGLARKDSLGNSVRKSKRKRNSFYKMQQPVKKKIDQKELEFLEKYWTDINTLFSTSLLFGAYSRTGRSRLREKCRMFHKLLSTWREIVKSNPDWIGGDIVLPDNPNNGDESREKSSSVDQFEKMDVIALRAYIINSVKEVNRIKHKLRTRNSYFKILYNKFVKRRMKRTKTLSKTSSSVKKETPSSANSTTNTPTDLSSDESSRDKEKATEEDNKPCVTNEIVPTTSPPHSSPPSPSPLPSVLEKD